MYDRCMIKEDDNDTGRIYLGESHVLSNDNLMISEDDGEDCVKCRQRKMSKVGGSKSYIL